MTLRNYSEFLSEFPSYKENFSLSESEGLSHRTKRWLYNELEAIIVDETVRANISSVEVSDFEYDAAFVAVNHILSLAWPNFDPDMPGYIVIWANEKARLKGRAGRISLKAGRGFRKLFPCLKDFEIEKLVDNFRAKFTVSELTVHESQEQEVFKDIFSGKMAAYENPYTTSSRKFLGNSCMRYSFAEIDHHPAEAYASGDFTLFYALDDEKRVAGRCVVFTGQEKWQAAPIYGVSENAIAKIESYIQSRNPDTVFNINDISWDGAKMLLLKQGNGVILPYIDLYNKRLTLHDDGYLVFDEYGEYHADTVSGVVYPQNGKLCCCCDEHVEENYLVSHHGQDYCEECFHDRFAYCEHCDEYEPVDDFHSVYVITRRGNIEQIWCDHCSSTDSVLITTSNGAYERWHENDVITTYNGRSISPEMAESEYFTSDWDGEWYPFDMMVELEDGSVISTDELAEDSANNNWVQNSHGIWCIEEKDEEEHDRENETEETANA